MPIQTPICDFGQKAHDFKLKSTDGEIPVSYTHLTLPTNREV